MGVVWRDSMEAAHFVGVARQKQRQYRGSTGAAQGQHECIAASDRLDIFLRACVGERSGGSVGLQACAPPCVCLDINTR